MIPIVDFTKDIIDNIPNFSFIQIGLLLSVFIILFAIEYLIRYNSILYGSMPMSIPGFGPPPPPSQHLATSSSTQKIKHKRKSPK